MKKNKLLPFGMMPGSWGLVGKAKERAAAEYTLTGEDLDRRLAEIDHAGKDLVNRNIELDLKHGKITQYEHDKKKTELWNEGKELEKKLLDNEVEHKRMSAHERDQKSAKIDFEGEDLIHKLLRIEYDHHKINEQEYDKRIAELCGEPYIGVKSSHFDLATGRFGIEYDWNDMFIKLLVENGYVGVTEADIVQAWFNGQNIDSGSETAGEPGVPVGQRTRKNKLDDDATVKYS